MLILGFGFCSNLNIRFHDLSSWPYYCNYFIFACLVCGIFSSLASDTATVVESSNNDRSCSRTPRVTLASSSGYAAHAFPSRLDAPVSQFSLFHSLINRVFHAGKAYLEMLTVLAELETRLSFRLCFKLITCRNNLDDGMRSEDSPRTGGGLRATRSKHLN